VVILSPQVEAAQHHINEAPSGPAEVSQKHKSEKNTLGVFAKLLAGLRGNIPKDNAALDLEEKGLLIQTGAEVSVDSSETDDLLLLSIANEKGIRTEKTVSETDSLIEKTSSLSFPNTVFFDETGEIEPEFNENNLFGIERLVIQAEEQVITGEKNVRIEGSKKSPEMIFTQTESSVETRNTLPEVAATDSAKDAKKSKNQANSSVFAANNRNSGTESANSALRQAELKTAAAGGKDRQNRLDEVRNRRRTMPLEVRDYRSAETDLSKNNFSVRAGFNQAAVAEMRLAGDGAVKEITLELRLPQGQEASTPVTSWEAKAGNAFEDMLARELHQNFNNDIIRHASVILRDGNEGTIRLALKPESLGNVKISLELAENKITGHIVVESEEAMRAFEREISSLEKAFREAGFDGAALSMSLAQDGRGAQQWQETEASRNLSFQFAASRYDQEAGSFEMPLSFDFYRQGAGLINVLA